MQSAGTKATKKAEFRRRFSQDLPNDLTVSIPWVRAGVGLTSSGYFFVASILYLVFSSSRHGLNSGYLVLFCLGILLVLSSWTGLLVIAGLKITAHPGEAVAAGSPPFIDLEIKSSTKKYGIEIWTDNDQAFVALDVEKEKTSRIRLHLCPRSRGVFSGPKLVIQTRQPLGLWRIYVRWEPSMTLVVFPTPEAQQTKPHCPGSVSMGPKDESHRLQKGGGATTGGLKPYEEGDTQRNIAWRIYAKTDGSVLATREREFEATAGISEYRLEDAMKAGDLESALQRMTGWVLEADRKGHAFSMKLGGQLLGPSQGPNHLQRCLAAMAGFTDYTKITGQAA